MKKFFLLPLFVSISSMYSFGQPYTIIVSGPTDICGANSTSLSVTPANGTLYRWFVYPAYPSGMPAYVGPVFFAPFSGIFLCEVTTSSGVFITTNTVTIRNTADTYIPAPIPSIVCSPGTVTLYEQTSNLYFMLFYNSYQWKKDGISIPGANFWYYSANSTGNYSCSVTNNCGSGTSNAVSVTVDPPLPTPGSMTASGPTTFCNGGSVLLSVPFDAAYIFQWTKDGINIPAANASSYNATTNGMYLCNISDACGIVIVGPITVTAVPYPDAIIAASGPTTFSFGESVTLYGPPDCMGCSYQWKNGGVIIPGATSFSYTTCSSGSFTIWVSSSGCASESAPVVVTEPFAKPQQLVETKIKIVVREGREKISLKEKR